MNSSHPDMKTNILQAHTLVCAFVDVCSLLGLHDFKYDHEMAMEMYYALFFADPINLYKRDP